MKATIILVLCAALAVPVFASEQTTALLIIDIQDFYFPGGKVPLVEIVSQLGGDFRLANPWKGGGVTLYRNGRKAEDHPLEGRGDGAAVVDVFAHVRAVVHPRETHVGPPPPMSSFTARITQSVGVPSTTHVPSVVRRALSG